MPILQLSHLYPLSLLVTIIVELMVVFTVARTQKACLISIILNLITHPWAYYFWEYTFPVIFIEIVVIVIESLGWYYLANYTIRKSALLAIATNIFSYVLGNLVTSLL